MKAMLRCRNGGFGGGDLFDWRFVWELFGGMNPGKGKKKRWASKFILEFSSGSGLLFLINS
jgi:hypothetical protein